MSALQAPEAQSLTDRAWEIYYSVRSVVETPENIGKLLLLDLSSGDYVIAQDGLGFAASRHLRERHPAAEVFTLRIGYDSTMSFSGSMERLAK